MAGRPRKTAASVTTEIVLGAAAQNLKKAVAELNVAVQSVTALESKGEELTLMVSNKEDQISELEVQFAEKERTMALDLDLKMKANALNVVNEYLKNQGQTAIASVELNQLRSNLQLMMDNHQKEVDAEVGKARGMAKSQYEAEKRLLEAEHKGAQAENISKISALEKEVMFLTTQVAKWEAALGEERKAGVQRAQASAVGTIQVGTEGYRK